MKIRNSFVTNSSSSSFIIGKSDDTSVTVDMVFCIIRDLYREFLQKKEELLSYLSLHNMGIFFDEKLQCFSFIDKHMDYKKEREIKKFIEATFGLSIYDYFHYDFGWLDCINYNEFEQYWLAKSLDKTNQHQTFPFTIFDYSKDTSIRWIVDGKVQLEDLDKMLTSDILCWYYEGLDCLLYDPECFKSCEDPCCDNGTLTCASLAEKINSINIKNGNACLELLGRVCISSECGHIPDYVVRRLSDISEYSCNHMG